MKNLSKSSIHLISQYKTESICDLSEKKKIKPQRLTFERAFEAHQNLYKSSEYINLTPIDFRLYWKKQNLSHSKPSLVYLVDQPQSSIKWGK